MGLFRNKKKGVAPHTWYPEILHWREGDQINCWNIAQAISVFGKKFDWGTYRAYVLDSNSQGEHLFKYRSVNNQGKIYLEDQQGHLVEFEFYRLIKYARNETLKSRKLEQQLADSQDYMELMQNFQQAFDELQAADNHPKRLGSGEEQTRND